MTINASMIIFCMGSKINNMGNCPGPLGACQRSRNPV